MTQFTFGVSRVMEMPYAFQCCAFMACETSPEPWATEESSGIKDLLDRRGGELMPRPGEVCFYGKAQNAAQDLAVTHKALFPNV